MNKAKRDVMAKNDNLTYTQFLIREIKRAGLPVLKSTEPNRVEDGMIEITSHVHVQVPAFEGYPGVVVEKQGKYKFLPPRLLVKNLMQDIKRNV